MLSTTVRYATGSVRAYSVPNLPARVGKPCNKSKLAVQVVECWIPGALHDRLFVSLPELNGAIRELPARINTRPFKKREGSRLSYSGAAKPRWARASSGRYVRCNRLSVLLFSVFSSDRRKNPAAARFLHRRPQGDQLVVETRGHKLCCEWLCP